MEEQAAQRLGTKKSWIIAGIMLAFLAFCALLLYGMIQSMQHKGGAASDGTQQPVNYSYAAVESTNGFMLHVLKTRPANVKPQLVQNNVALTPYYGINGGFFYEKSLLSIAVVNSLAVNEEQGEYGSGSENAKYARGTLVWDGVKDQLSVQIASNASELKVQDHTRFWAQGGISMSIGNDAGWLAQAEKEHAPFPDDDRLRSAAVYDQMGNIYLVVSSTKGSLAAFREAIIEKIGDNKLAGGLFLDGDGSSQLRSAEATLQGDSRSVVQMMRIMK
ncbi:hypothetical protein SAMN04487969_101525 [Paenibacillus algorifonticola]|uniref:Phosphodiester glycosidase domain-containing protein n=1 Tax=Paenibacillus algorifonticola TaxID=684063 RepID=A0A1I1YFW7_9BACL|nr:hypothetical protein [Paenibacillus algorifonticola]SFE18477.1 hypothetical protein SAMN04487969_101525 [Paenibacillus algorifonticola]